MKNKNSLLVKVGAYENAIQAHLARGRLEEEGIPAFVCHEHHVWAYWLYSLLLGGVKVYVHVKDEDRAREVVSAHDGGAYALPDEETPSCPRCKSEQVTRRRASWKAALLTANLVSVPLYFAWATRKCGHCGNEWDLPNTRAYPLMSPIIVAVASMALLFILTTGTACLIGKMYYGADVFTCKTW